MPVADEDIVPKRALHILADTSLGLELKTPEVEHEQKLCCLCRLKVIYCYSNCSVFILLFALFFKIY